MYINKAMVYGNLTRDPEMRALPSGQNVCNFSIATNRRYRDRDGNQQEATEFHNIVVFGKQADLVSQYLKKGSTAFVEGRLQTRSWEADGQKKYRTEIVADNVQFGPRGAGGESQQARGDNAPGEKGKGDSIEYPEEEINPDDIPF